MQNCTPYFWTQVRELYESPLPDSGDVTRSVFIEVFWISFIFGSFSFVSPGIPGDSRPIKNDCSETAQIGFYEIQKTSLNPGKRVTSPSQAGSTFYHMASSSPKYEVQSCTYRCRIAAAKLQAHNIFQITAVLQFEEEVLLGVKRRIKG